MNKTQIIAQIINGIGTTLNIIGINIKEKKKLLLCFVLGNIFLAIALRLLNATAGMLVQIVFVSETILNYFLDKKYDKYPLWIILLYVILPCTILVISFKSKWDILPIISGILFPLALLSKDFKLRLLNLFSILVWIPYNFVFGQYVGTIGCIIFAITNFMAIIRLDILKSKENIKKI